MDDQRKPEKNQVLTPFCKLPIDLRTKLQKYAYMAKYAYDTSEPGYQEFYKIRNLSQASGFDFKIFKDGKDTVIAIRGTDEMEDAFVDGKLFLGKTDPQNFWAETLLKTVLDKTDGNIILTGHSLGGYQAVNAAIRVNDDRITEVYTYNSPGFQSSLINGFPQNSVNSIKNKTVNVNDTRDPVHHVGQQIGKTVNVINSAGFIDDLVQLIPFYQIKHNHSIDTLINRMDACKNK